MSIKGQFLKRLTALTAFRDKSAGTSTTISAAAAADATVIVVTSATGVTVGKCFRLGSGETSERVEVSAVSGSNITLAKKLLFAHAALEPVVERQGYAIDAISGGVKTTHAKDTPSDFSGMQRLAYAKLEGYQNLGLEFTLKGYTIANICIALGIPFSSIKGTGASISDVLSMATDLNDTDSEQNVDFVATYVRHDGTVIVEEFWNCAADYTALSMQLAFGQNGHIPCKFVVCAGAVQSVGAISYVLQSNTYRASAGKTFGHLTSVGLWLDDAGGSTVATAAAADATSLVLADASDFAEAGWAAILNPDGTELHWIDGITSATLDLKTHLKRKVAVGTAVVPVTLLEFATITKEGATFAVGGSSSPIQTGLRDLAIGVQAENAEASVMFKLQEITNAARAYVAGIAQGDITSDDRVLLTKKLGKATGVRGVSLQGVHEDGTINMLNTWGAAQDLSDLGAEMLTANNTSRQYKSQATSGVQFVQYAA